MPALPIDSTQITLVATGKVRPVKVYAEMGDGSRRAVPDSQDKSDAGIPLWQVDVLVDDDEADRAEPVAVKVASEVEPQVTKFAPVPFQGLRCTPYVDRRTNRVGLSFRADGIAPAQANGRKSAAATAGEGDR